MNEVAAWDNDIHSVMLRSICPEGYLHGTRRSRGGRSTNDATRPGKSSDFCC